MDLEDFFDTNIDSDYVGSIDTDCSIVPSGSFNDMEDSIMKCYNDDERGEIVVTPFQELEPDSQNTFLEEHDVQEIESKPDDKRKVE